MPVAWDQPDAFAGSPLQRVDLVPVLTGSAYSSHAPASFWVQPVIIPAAARVSNIAVFKSLNASVPQATSANSSGSVRYSYTHGVSVFTRQDYAGNSSNLSLLATASGGITATMSWSSGSQTAGLSWVTNTTGGTSGVSTTSGAGNWSSSFTGPKLFQIPFVRVLTAGEYWFAHGHSSTTATVGSDVTLLSVSNLHVAPQVITAGVLGQTVTLGSVGPGAAGFGIASALTTNATMAASVVTNATLNAWVQVLQNF